MTGRAEFSKQKQRLVATYNLMSVGYDKQRFVRLCASRLVELVSLRGGEKVLDVATGTGWASMAAAQSVGSTGHVVGVDIAEDMLEQAQRKIDVARLTNVELVEADAEHMDFPANSFDAVICASSIFFLPDMLEAVREWQRVTKKGGRVGFSTFGDMMFQPMRNMLFTRLRSYGASLPTQTASQRLTDPEKCRDLLRDAGFEDIEVHTEQLGYYLSTAEEYWEDSVAWNGATHNVVSQLSPEKLKRFKAEHLAEVKALATDQGIWVNLPAIFVLGHKP